MKRFSARIAAYSDMRRDEREQRMGGRMRLLGRNTLPALLSHHQREALVVRMREVMSRWTSTHFEREGVARHAIRSVFCAGGATWDMADQEAARIVSAALSAMGAQRPSWEEGQRSHVVSEDYCKWCMGPMEYGGGSRYCCADCAKSAFTHREMRSTGESAKAYFDTYRAMQRYANPAVPCAECGKEFHPRVEKGRAQEFCSNSCKSKDTQRKFIENPVAIHCEVCGQAALSHGVRVAKFCGLTCQQISMRLRKGWVPKRLSSQLFDLYITVPVEAGRPKWITPERFDELVAA